jgi:hypothetical protein
LRNRVGNGAPGVARARNVNYYSPEELEPAIARFVDVYNQERVPEAIGNITPDDVSQGRRTEIVSRRQKIERLTLERRKKENLRNAA